MKLLSQKLTLTILGLGLALTTTGCMTGPGHGEHVGNIEGNVDFNGYLMDEPNTWVKIQAKHPTYGWQTIGWARSKSWSVPYSGADWNPWNASIKVPLQYWTFIGTDNPNGQFKAEVRAVNYSTGNQLANFDAGYNEYFEYEEPLGDMWAAHGHSGAVTIYGNVYIE